MGLIIVALLGMLGVFGAVCSKLLADEFKAWAPSVTAKIIAAAVRKLPTPKRERFSEEWASHVQQVPGDIGKIAAACGCLVAAWKIAEGPFDARKRALDVALATWTILFEAPVLIIVACLIAADSPGPIFSRQTRIGRNGKPFQSLKFRTFHVDADDRLREYLATNPEARMELAVTKRLRFDPRVTLLGSILRKSTVDELPQLFNVLAGDMSLVGSRPVSKDEFRASNLSDTDTACKPGITGLWKFSHHSKSYTRNWSLTLDVKIILATIALVIRKDEEEQKYPRDLDANWKIGLAIIFGILGVIGILVALS